MKPVVRKTLKVTGIIVGIFLLLYTGLLLYVSANKTSLIEKATTALSDKLDGKVAIGDVDISFFGTFPYASLVLKNVAITDTMFSQHKHPLVNAEKIYARISISRLFKKELAINGVKVNKAFIYLYTDTSGYSNTYLLGKKETGKKAAPGKSADEISFKSIELNDVHFIIDDQRSEKLHDLAVKQLDVKIDDISDSVLELSTKADIKVNSLAFNKEAGSFAKGHHVKGKFDLFFNTNLSQLFFDSIDLKISGHPFNIGGRFDLKGDEPQFTFRAHTQKVPYDFAKSVLTQKIATSMSIANVDKPVDADVYMQGPLKGGDPLIHAYWSVKGAHLSTPFFDFDNATLKGYYTDEVTPGLPRRDPNSKIVITDFFATWHDLPVSSNSIEILNLFQPILTCDLRSAFPLTKLNEIVGSSSIVMDSGEGSIDVNYQGPIIRNNNTNSFLNGSIGFINGTIDYVPRNVKLQNVNGKLAFRNSNVYVENLTCEVLNNKFRMEGTALNLLTLVNSEIDKVNIDWNIYSPALNLNSFLYLLKSRKNVARTKKSKNKSLDDIANNIDAVLERSRVNVKLNTPTMTYKKLTAHNVNANVELLQDRYVIKNVSMNQAGGNMQLHGALIGSGNDQHAAALNIELSNVDVNTVFNEFNNFGQTGIEGKNLSGKLSADVTANMLINAAGDVNPNSIKSIVNFSLKNGALIDFEPLKKVQDHIFKNRDFDNIKFAEIKNKLEIADKEVKINRMEIQSSVIGLFVEGVYSMRGNTDISIQVPLSNLKKRSDDFIPKNIGVDNKAGASIYLRGRPGSDGNIQFKPDLFKKLRKE